MNPPKPKLLELKQPHISEQAARIRVENAVRVLNPNQGKFDWKGGTITKTTAKGKQRTLSIPELVRETQTEGFSRSLYKWIDGQDPYFGWTFSLGGDAAGKIRVNFAGYSKELKTPARAAPIEEDLTDDILSFRRDICEDSSFDRIQECARSYRAFLQASITLIDAFLNRYIIVDEANQPGSIPESLRKTSSFSTRIELWRQIFTDSDVSQLKKTSSWSQLSVLRKERNKMVHAAEPYLGVSLSEMPRILNLVNVGVGETMLTLRSMRGESSLEFIERLRHAPEVVGRK